MGKSACAAGVRSSHGCWENSLLKGFEVVLDSEVGNFSSVRKSSDMSDLRPKLCVLEKGSGGYGFHLHGEKGKTGQFIRLVEPDTPAAGAGLLAGDRLAFVNGESVEGESHQQVVARIRATRGALELIVVDPDTAELLKKHGLQCRKEFVAEGIPVPGGDSDSDGEDARSNGTPAPRENGDASSERSERLSVSSSTKVQRGTAAQSTLSFIL